MVKKTIFISYAKEDRTFAIKIYEDLEKAGLNPWLDEKDLLPGYNWKHHIGLAIRNSNFFIALLSNNSLSKKGYVQKELKQAIEILDEYPYGEGFIIPIRLDECVPKDEKLVDIQWVDLFEDYQLCLSKILSTMNVHPKHSQNSKEYTTLSSGSYIRPNTKIESINNMDFQKDQAYHPMMEKAGIIATDKKISDKKVKHYYNDGLVGN